MPKIEGLHEQQEALSEIQKLLKELSSINEFLEKQNPDGLYEISFKLNEMIEPSLESEESSLEESGLKENKKKTKFVKYSAPFLCMDSSIVHTSVLAFKKEKVEKIRALSEKYHIYLDADDEAILFLHIKGDMNYEC